MLRRVWPGLLVAVLSPSVMAAGEKRADGPEAAEQRASAPEKSRAKEGLARAIANGASTEPVGTPLRGDRQLGLPANRDTLRPDRVLPTLRQTAPPPRPASGGLWYRGYGKIPEGNQRLLPFLQPYMQPEHGANLPEDKHYEPLSPGDFTLRQHSQQGPILRNDE